MLKKAKLKPIDTKAVNSEEFRRKSPINDHMNQIWNILGDDEKSGYSKSPEPASAKISQKSPFQFDSQAANSHCKGSKLPATICKNSSKIHNFPTKNPLLGKSIEEAKEEQENEDASVKKN